MDITEVWTMKRFLARAVIVAGLTAVAAMGAPCVAAETKADREQLRKSLSEAQARLDAAASEVADLSRQLYGGPEGDVVRFMRAGRRGAMLGVNIGTDKPRETGVEIVGVSPGGPAEAAGLRPADVIVALDGKTMKRVGDETAATQLVEYLSEVEPGAKVKVDYLRGDKRQTATVTTKAAEPPFFAMFRDRFDLPAVATLPDVVSLAPFEHLLGHGPGFGELELVEITPRLGSYFGTDKGLLVVRAPNESGYQLQEGDVLMGIDGRVPESPGHAFRILRSYQPGEKLKLDVLRSRKRMEVSVTVPRDRPMHGAAPVPRPAMPPRPPTPASPVPPPPEDDGPV
jgi:membrane-associated protease RseP (regulator of RpoE activity)